MTDGICYAVGVGPGDPEWLTLRAVRALKECPVVAVPTTGDGQSLAWEIAAQAVDLSGKRRLDLPFGMGNGPRREEDYAAAAAAVAVCLRAGHSVALLTLGDVGLYATGGQLAARLAGQGFAVERVAGVPSFCAAAARLGVDLTAGREPLTLCAGQEPVDAVLDRPGTKVFLKAGRELPALLDALRRRGWLERAALAVRCGLPGERLVRDLTRFDPAGAEDYFTLVIVKEGAL